MLFIAFTPFFSMRIHLCCIYVWMSGLWCKLNIEKNGTRLRHNTLSSSIHLNDRFVVHFSVYVCRSIKVVHIIKALSNNNNEKFIKRIKGAYIPIETAHLNDPVFVQCRLINGKLYKYTVCHNHKMGKSPLCSHCLFCLHSNICIQTNNIRISLETQQIKILLLFTTVFFRP